MQVAERQGDSPKASIVLLLVWCLGAAMVDYVSGPGIHAMIVVAIPVALAGWCGRVRLGLLVAAMLPLGRLVVETYVWRVKESVLVGGANAATRIVVLSALAVFAHRAAAARELARRVWLLEGILPICSYCKKIRDKDSNWHPPEVYLSKRSDVLFSHGICPSCAKSHFGEYLDENQQ